MRHLIRFNRAGHYLVADLQRLACSHAFREEPWGQDLSEFNLTQHLEPYVLEGNRFTIIRSQPD